MPLFYQQHINQNTRLAVWKIEESEHFFSESIPIQTNITHPNKRLQHLAGRYLLRYLFPAFPYEEILIADTKKPYLQNEAFHFSISHCNDYVAAIVSTNERVGIDLENQHEKAKKVQHKFITEEEKHLLQNLSQNIPESNIPTLIWAVKETMFKWNGKSEIDFKTMLLIELSEPIKSEGSFQSIIKSNENDIKLKVNYKVLKEFCLAYSHTA